LIKAQPAALLTQADSLARAGAYFEASVAYERVLFAAVDTDLSYRAALGKTQCLKRQQLFGPAVTFLNGQLTAPYPDSLRYQLRYEQVLCLYLAGQFENTLAGLRQLAYLHPTRQRPPVLHLIEVLSLNELQRWPEAAQSYRTYLNTLGIDTTSDDPYRHLPRLKSEKKAQWLSTFIPGAGHVYAGKPAEALLSLGMQAAGLYFGITSFLQAYYISAWGIGAALFGSFHMGGVRRAEVLVQQHNRKKIRSFNERIRGDLLQRAGRH